MLENNSKLCYIIQKALYAEIEGTVMSKKRQINILVSVGIIFCAILIALCIRFPRTDLSVDNDIFVVNSTQGDKIASVSEMDATTEKNSEHFVNINTAELQELLRVNGCSKRIAQAIIDYRDSNGLFKSVLELTDVPGIGEVTLTKMLPYITV